MGTKKAAKDKLKLVTLKMTKAEHSALIKQAKVYTHGNLSAWLRRAGLKYVPNWDDELE